MRMLPAMERKLAVAVMTIMFGCGADGNMAPEKPMALASITDDATETGDAGASVDNGVLSCPAGGLHVLHLPIDHPAEISVTHRGAAMVLYVQRVTGGLAEATTSFTLDASVPWATSTVDLGDDYNTAWITPQGGIEISSIATGE